MDDNDILKSQVENLKNMNCLKIIRKYILIILLRFKRVSWKRFNLNIHVSSSCPKKDQFIQ